MFAPLAATIFPRFAQARIDGRILLFTSGISAVSVLLFGLVPAFSLPKNESLAESRTTGNSRRRLAPILVSFQVAGALIMLTAAGLLLRTLWNIDNAPLGMQTNGVIVADVLLGKQACSTTLQCTAFFDQLEQRAGNLPGVKTLGVANDVPLAGGSGMISSSEVRVEGQPQRSPGSDFALNWRWVTPGFFSALKIHTLEGRVFREPDRESSDNFIVLNRVLAEKLFPSEPALDRRIQLDPKGPWYTVIGVVDNVKNYEPTMPTEPEYYLLRTHSADPGLHVPPMFYHYSVLVIRGNLPVSMIAKEIRSEVQSLNSSAVRQCFDNERTVEPLYRAAAFQCDFAEHLRRRQPVVGRDWAVWRDFVPRRRSARARSVCAWRWGLRRRASCACFWVGLLAGFSREPRLDSSGHTSQPICCGVCSSACRQPIRSPGSPPSLCWRLSRS